MTSFRRILFILILFLPYHAFATDYYVNPAATGADDGTSNVDAWTTVGEVNSKVFNDGDDVWFICDALWAQQRLVIDWSGTGDADGSRSIIGAYHMSGGVGTETHTVSGAKPIFDGENSFPTANQQLIKLNNDEKWVTVQDFELVNSLGAGVQAGSGSSFLTVQRCKVDYTWQPNIMFYLADNCKAIENECSRGGRERTDDIGGWPAGGIVFYKVTGGEALNNYVHEHWGEGINVQGTGILVDNNRIADCMSVHIYLDGAIDCTATYNLIYGTNETSFDHPSFPGWHFSGITLATEPTGTTQSTYGNKVHHNIIINCYDGVRFRQGHASYSVGVNYIYQNSLYDNKYNLNVSNPPGDDLDVAIEYINNHSYKNDAGSSVANISGPTLSNWVTNNNTWSEALTGNEETSFSDVTDEEGKAVLNKISWRNTTTLNNETFTINDVAYHVTSQYGIGAGATLDPEFDDIILPDSDKPEDPVSTGDQDDNPPWETGAVGFVAGEPQVPLPDPPEWLTAPYGYSSTEIRMEVDPLSDSTPPVEVLITNDNDGDSDAGAGGTTRTWSSTLTYADTVDDPNQKYGYKLQARDSYGTPNVGGTSSISFAYSLCNTPNTVTAANVDVTFFDIIHDGNNPSSNPTTLYAVAITSTVPTDDIWQSMYIKANGDPSATAVWLSGATWNAMIGASALGKSTALNGATTYNIRSKAKNGDGEITGFSEVSYVETDVPPTDASPTFGSGGIVSGYLN